MLRGIAAPALASASAGASSSRRWGLAALAASALLAGCGGGGDGPPPPIGTCTLYDQQTFLRSYFDDWYFWNEQSPSPAPDGYPTLSGYFDALLYTGTDPDFPPDRWSTYEPSRSFDRYFLDGRTLSYGLRVAALEVAGHPDQPLYVRYVDPGSPAAAAGIVRGDRVVALDGRSASSLIAGGDFSLLEPDSTSDALTVAVTGPTGDLTVTLPAAVYALTPVPVTSVTTTMLGRPMGYLLVNDLIDQGASAISSAFSRFRSEGVEEVVLDLRYNGGGLVERSRDLASYVAGRRADGEVFAQLYFNDRRAAANDQTFRFTDPSSALGLTRVYVLTGERSCSAAEQVINGLRPFVDVVTIGGTSCGKPVGTLPVAYCGTTYSVVNFEVANADNEGRYFDGFDPTCAVDEDFTRPIGGNDDPLVAAARRHADTGSCPPPAATAAARAHAAAAGRSAAARALLEPGERRAMVVR